MAPTSYAFGRLYVEDKRDEEYPLTLPFEDDSSRRVRNWTSNWWTGDQGSAPACAGFAAAHWLASAPINQWLNPFGLYKYANATDEWAPEQHDGTSIRSVMKVLSKLGFIKEYRWTNDLNTLIETVLNISPVVVGTSWSDKMSNPGADGFMNCSGNMDYGHAYLIVGVDRTPKHEYFTIRNSWGRDWGIDGKAKIRFKDMQRLISKSMYGEVCLAVEREISPNI